MIKLIGRKKILKALAFGIVLSIMCVLTFICDAEIQVDATDTLETAPVTTSNEASDTSNDYLEGSLGGLTFQFSGDDTGSLSATLQILLVLTVISLAPSILIMLTSFTRIVIVLHFVRTALGTQTTPPNQILVGLALFLTFFIMSPTLTRINNEAIQPLSRGEISSEQALERGMTPIRDFMFEQMDGGEKDLRLFLDIAGRIS